MLIRSSTEAVMIRTPVRIVGSGEGTNSAECSDGSCLPRGFAFGDLFGCDCAQPQHGRRNLVTFQTEQAEVFADHVRARLNDIVGANSANQHSPQSVGQFRIVVGHGRRLRRDRNERHAIGRHATGYRNSLGGAFQVGEDLFLHVRRRTNAP